MNTAANMVQPSPHLRLSSAKLMNKPNNFGMNTEPTKKLLTTKTVFSITIIVASLTVIGVWMFGLGQHRSIYENSIMSTTILSVGFFCSLQLGCIMV